MALKTRQQAAREAEAAKDTRETDQEASQSPPTASRPATPTPPASDTDTVALPKVKHGGRTFGAASWKPWEDRALALEVQAVRPWTAVKVGGGKSHAWDEVALRMRSSHAGFARDGSACKNHFGKLIKLHRQGELRAKQTTGEGGEVDQFIEIMTDIDTQLQDQAATKTAATESSKAKQQIERSAGLALRAAATKGLVTREELDDITVVEGSSAREKAGQRKRPQLSRSPSSLERQDPEPATKQRKRTNLRQEMKTLMEARQEADDKVLEEARQVQDQQHRELTQALNTMSGNISNLVDVIAEDRRVQREVNSNRQAEQTLLLSVIEKLAKPA